MYAFAPEKTPSLVGRNFCLAIVRVFAKASKLINKEVHGIKLAVCDRLDTAGICRRGRHGIQRAWRAISQMVFHSEVLAKKPFTALEPA
jgi:hypothetical protein